MRKPPRYITAALFTPQPFAAPSRCAPPAAPPIGDADVVYGAGEPPTPPHVRGRKPLIPPFLPPLCHGF
jgi:hypothetical protein